MTDIAGIRLFDRQIRWLSAWTVHHANHVRPSRDGLKVGGHQASSASIATIMSVLYGAILTPRDRVAVKPHASPVFHAIQYLFGKQEQEQLERFRAFGGAQSYPSRTKDRIDVDFSTGSVGLGVAMTSFASMLQDYLIARGHLAPDRAGRMVALLGDAELDEGNIYEAMLEGAKFGLRNCWWIVDYNRQSLDAITPELMARRFEAMFRATDWQVHILKYGKALEAAFGEPGGERLRDWIEGCPNDLYAALSYKGGAAFRARILEDAGEDRALAALLARRSDDELGRLMANLAGHDPETLLEAFSGITDDGAHCFIVYTIKGYGLPFQGHKDNHAGLMTPAQMAAFRSANAVRDGEEWSPFAGLDDEARETLAHFLRNAPFNRPEKRRYEAETIPVPALPVPEGAEQSTQLAFGKILNEIGRTESPLSARIVTTSPDVTVSTNLGGWVNRRGLFSREDREDVFRREEVVSAQRWGGARTGQHLELGIAESNLFLALAAFGLSHSLFGERLLPVGTLYDPFINRGLDALNYACYQDARFLLVATPSGLTLAPEGGAHQSIHTPLIGMAQDKLLYYEPAFVDELAAIMAFAFRHMQEADGSSVYLRLSTRSIAQPARRDGDWQAGTIAGGYWMHPPAEGAEFALAYCGALAPEAMTAFAAIREDIPGAGLLAITSPDRLHRDWRAQGRSGESHIARLLAPLASDAALVTAIDGASAALSWLGSVRGQPVAALGFDRFGQSGDLPDLYRAYRLDADAMIDAAARALLARRS
ncbi:MAG: pyruvate dehydrogenase E1 component [Rhodothalassiaceae bacterium]